MKTTLFAIISMVLFSCNHNGSSNISSADADSNHESSLAEGEHYIDIDGVKLWYMVRGEGPILILYPSSAGWGGDCSIYIEYFKPWEKQRKVIYFEPRGLGQSDRLDSINDYSMEKYVEELEHFRKKLGIEKFDLYGHCYAGMISLQYALKYQEHLRSMILMSTWPTPYPGYEEWAKNRPGYEDMINRSATIQKEGLKGEEGLREWMKNSFRITFYDYEKHKADFEHLMDKTIFSILPPQQFAVDHPKYNIVKDLSKIKVKTLIIYGDNDVPPAYKGAQVLKENLPDSELIEIKNSSHWSFMEQPEQFFSETIGFLRNLK